MKIKRRKGSKRRIAFYRNYFGFHPPYKVIIDGTFCAHALSNKINFKEQIPNYLGDETFLFSTPCVLKETEKIGPALHKVNVVLKQLEIENCHHNVPLTASECLHSIIGQENSNHYFIATQDFVLKKTLLSIPSCPTIDFKKKNMMLCKPPKSALEFVAQNAQRDKLNEIRQFEKPIEIKKRKRKGGPNPLSIKKKKKANIVSKTNVQKRKRKRVKKRKFSKVIEFIRKFESENNTT